MPCASALPRVQPRVGRRAERPGPDEHAGSDRGSVTAELALALPALVVVLSALLGGIGAGVAQVRCVDAARDGARELARGEGASSLTAVVAATAPGASVTFAAVPGKVTVLVEQEVELAGLGTGWTVRGRAVALTEIR